jgi:hyperosmotically inducible periplasmic protein
MKASRAGRWCAAAFVAFVALMALNAQAQLGSGVFPAPNAARDPNRQLESTVLRALHHTGGLNASSITVWSRDGRVTLQGSVPERSQLDLALRTAQRVQGVRSVHSQLVVRPAGR